VGKGKEGGEGTAKGEEREGRGSGEGPGGKKDGGIEWFGRGWQGRRDGRECRIRKKVGEKREEGERVGQKGGREAGGGKSKTIESEGWK